MINMTLNCAIIIPLYNKEQHIWRALDSVLNQTIKFRQVIVVNDCSTDKSAEVVERFIAEYPQIPITFIQHLRNSGPGGARNTGLDASSCDYVCFLDADDYLCSTAAEGIFRVLANSDPSPGLIIYRVKEQGGGVVRPNFHRLKKLGLLKVVGVGVFKVSDWASTMIAEPLFCSGGNVVVSRGLCKSRFNPAIRNFEDWDFYFRACLMASQLGVDILISDHIGLTYTEDDQHSLSRSAVVSQSLRTPPPFVLDTSLPLKVRRYTTGIWLCHVTQRSNWIDGLHFIVKSLRQVGDARPIFIHLLAAVIGLLIGRKGWAVLSQLRKKVLYV